MIDNWVDQYAKENMKHINWFFHLVDKDLYKEIEGAQYMWVNASKLPPVKHGVIVRDCFGVVDMGALKNGRIEPYDTNMGVIVEWCFVYTDENYEIYKKNYA